MNILEGVKPVNLKNTTTKFIIKSKPSSKENKASIDSQSDIYANNVDVHQFITYMVTKSKHLTDHLASKGIEEPHQFAESHLYDNPSIRTLLKSVMDRMLTERRIGKNLKGMNKSIMQEIEGAIWSTLEREITLYQLNKMYHLEKEELERQLADRRIQIQHEIEALSSRSIEKQLVASPRSNHAQ